jgi:isoleucyl-tRNA synthetase
VRRSRERFWAGERDAIDTLHTVLEVTCRVAAPLLPLITETVWRGLTGGRSVHLADWPLVDELPSDSALVEAMDRVRQVCSSALALRTAAKLRVRLPLPRLLVAARDAGPLGAFTDVIRDEVNVKEVELSDDVAAHGRFELAVNARIAGPRLGKDVQAAIKAAKAGDWVTTAEGRVYAGGIELLEGEYERRLVSRDAGAAAELPYSSGLVILDTEVTPALVAEGIARDAVRVVQQARREAGLDVSDRIELTIDAPESVLPALREHERFIASETLGVDVRFSSVADGFRGTVGDGVEIAVGVARARAEASRGA